MSRRLLKIGNRPRYALFNFHSNPFRRNANNTGVSSNSPFFGCGGCNFVSVCMCVFLAHFTMKFFYLQFLLYSAVCFVCECELLCVIIKTTRNGILLIIDAAIALLFFSHTYTRPRTVFFVFSEII